MKQSILLGLLLVSTYLVHVSPLHAQLVLNDLESEAYFDFWLGTWELTWENMDGTTAKGTNQIERILDGKVIKESFRALTGDYEGFAGESYSVYNIHTGKWKQTWVDSNGGYLDFIGEFEGNKRIFKRKGTTPAGRDILQRMVFYNITDKTFTWDWEVSEDNGNTWQLRWSIEYERVE